MPCFSPLDGWLSRQKTKLGKRQVAFRFKEALHDLPITVPCGKCVGCLMERARQWSVRAVHEAKLWPKNCFVTLTYDDEHLPLVEGSSVPTLRYRDFQLFMKRLRKERDERIRFLSAGEYGSRGRPHYHCLLFNCDFPDKRAFEGVGKGGEVFRSEELEELWPLGFSTIGEVTKESSAYVARYTVKKVSELDHPDVEKASGGVRGDYRADGSEKEFLRMSRRPGIGAGWFDKYHRDVYPADRLVLADGKVVRPPRYYDAKYAELDPRRWRKIRRKRVDSVVREEQRPGRLIAKEINVQRRLDDFMKRSLS